MYMYKFSRLVNFEYVANPTFLHFISEDHQPLENSRISCVLLATLDQEVYIQSRNLCLMYWNYPLLLDTYTTIHIEA